MELYERKRNENEKAKAKERAALLALLWCVGRVVRQDTLRAIAPLIVFQLLMVRIIFGMMNKAIGLTLVSLRTGPIRPSGQSVL